MSRLKRSVLYWLCLSPLAVVILLPYAVMLSTALKPRAEVLSFPPAWIGSELRFANFSEMWEVTGFGPSLASSLIVSAAATVVCLLVAVPAAYALARLRFRGRGLYAQLLLITQMLSPIVLVIGIFRLMAAMGLTDQLWSLILTYGAFNLAFAVWMLQSYFATIPKELEEAAWIDGASGLQSLTLVFLPLAMPAVAVTSIFVFIYSWNEFVLALTLMRSPDKFTLPLKIFSLVGGAYRISWEYVMAATFLASVPVAIVFSWLQRYLVRGLSVGSVK
jgi:multiple sugar transport system permease protein